MNLPRHTASTLALAATLAAAMPSLAQESVSEDAGVSAPQAVESTGGAAEILVVATRIPGSVETRQPPVATFDEADIEALGAGSLSDLLTAIAPQAGSGRGRGEGRPVVLLNGQRISGFRELRNFPPEAIRKVEVLPEEVALKFGFRPDQRVVNFILKDNFRSVTVDGEARFPGGGGFSEQEFEASLARIDGTTRLNLTATLQRTSPLTEAERGIVQPAVGGAEVAGDPEIADFRTLIGESRSAALNATWARGLGNGGQLSLNGTVTRSDDRSLFGLQQGTLIAPDGARFVRTTLDGGPLERSGDTLTVQAGAALNRPLGAWMLSATADYTRTRSDTMTGRRADFGTLQSQVTAGTLLADGVLPGLILPAPDRARSTSNVASGLVTLVGRPLRLPAGEASLTLKTGYDYSALSSSDTRNPGIDTNLKRGDLSAGFSLDVPLTSRRENFGAGIGDLSLNLNADVDHLSDFGTLVGYGAGLTWGPTERLTLQASYIAAEAAPGLAQLGAPTVVTPGVSVYDFARGETVLVNVTSGGNPLLDREKRRDWKLGLNWDLPVLRNSRLVVEYFSNRSTDTANGFPLLTPAIEAAFPGRVTRDAAGRLLAIDQRPVTFAEEKSEHLRYGVSLGGSLGKPDPKAGERGRGGGMGRGRGGPGMGMDAGMGGPGMGGRGGDGRGRWNLGLYHTVRFSQTVQIAPGGPVLDLLDGQAISGGGVARHAIELEGGAFYRGFGLRVNGSYTGGSRIDGTAAAGTLSFAPIATFDVRAFADLGRMDSVTRAVPFLKGSRLSFRVENLFDAQQRVTDASGAVPLRYQPGYLDPRGRVFEIEFRKQF